MKLKIKKIIAIYVKKMDILPTHVSLMLKERIKIETIQEKMISESKKVGRIQKFHSNNIKSESDSTDSEDSEEENINIGFSGNITVNNITQSTKENDKTEWIID